MSSITEIELEPFIHPTTSALDDFEYAWVYARCHLLIVLYKEMNVREAGDVGVSALLW